MHSCSYSSTYFRKERKQMTPTDVLTATAERFGVTLDELTGASRTAYVSAARQAAIYILRKRFHSLSYADCARLVGRGDHTTAVHAIHRAGLRMRQDAWYAGRINGLLEGVTGNA